MPPLRERGEDVIEIAELLLDRYAREEGKAFRRLSRPVRDALCAYPWPGNVRQLENVLRHAIVLHDGEDITLDMLPATILAGGQAAGPAHSRPHLTIAASGRPAGAAPVQPSHAEDEAALRGTLRRLVGATLADIEREFIEATIVECKGSIPRAARLLDVSPSTLYRKREAWERSAS
jgi:DNA-binding NtrC family response regulator